MTPWLLVGLFALSSPAVAADCPDRPAPRRQAPLQGPSAAPGPDADDQTASGDPLDAPGKPAPWLKSPLIYGAQVVGGLGLRMLLAPCAPVPVVGPLALLTGGPLLEAFGVTWTGDRLGDGRAPLAAAWLASLAVGGTGALLAGAANLVLLGLTLVATLVSTPALVAALGLPELGSTGRVAVLLVVLGGSACGALALLASNVLGLGSPLASTALYQLTKSRKADSDDGTGPVHLFRAPRRPPPAAEPPR